MKAIVLHNTGDGMFWEFIPEAAALSHAHTFDLPGRLAGPGPLGGGHLLAADVAEWVYTMCNVEPETLGIEVPLAEQVHAYRARRNRSLSVGDVVVLAYNEQPLVALAYNREGLMMVALADENSSEAAERLLASIDLSDVDNHLEHSLAWEAHVAIRDNPPTPYVSPLPPL